MRLTRSTWARLSHHSSVMIPPSDAAQSAAKRVWEEVASASALLTVIDRAGVDNMLLVEAYLAQASVAAAEPSAIAPPAAGGAL
jgi:hypothetical protein